MKIKTLIMPEDVLTSELSNVVGGKDENKNVTCNSNGIVNSSSQSSKVF